jgi:hypothetical protein
MAVFVTMSRRRIASMRTCGGERCGSSLQMHSRGSGQRCDGPWASCDRPKYQTPAAQRGRSSNTRSPSNSRTVELGIATLTPYPYPLLLPFPLHPHCRSPSFPPLRASPHLHNLHSTCHSHLRGSTATMSSTWRITKKLKETHLAPLANTFSRSSSTSTITDDKASKTPSAASSETAVDSKDPSGIGTPMNHVCAACSC